MYLAIFLPNNHVRLDKKAKIKSKVLQLFLLIQITPKEQSHIGWCLFYVLLTSGNTYSLCPLDFAQKCCQNAGIMPFQRPKFQTFSGMGVFK